MGHHSIFASIQSTNISSQLSGIRENTSRYLFWTIMISFITTTLLLLHTLNALWYKLDELNAHQAEYKDMWVQEREEMAAQIRHEEETRTSMFQQLAAQISVAGQTPPLHRQQQKGRQQAVYRGQSQDSYQG
jgi:hypothetical protein